MGERGNWHNQPILICFIWLRFSVISICLTSLFPSSPSPLSKAMLVPFFDIVVFQVHTLGDPLLPLLYFDCIFLVSLILQLLPMDAGWCFLYSVYNLPGVWHCTLGNCHFLTLDAFKLKFGGKRSRFYYENWWVHLPLKSLWVVIQFISIDVIIVNFLLLQFLGFIVWFVSFITPIFVLLLSSALYLECVKHCVALLMILDGCNTLQDWLLWRMGRQDSWNCLQA